MHQVGVGLGGVHESLRGVLVVAGAGGIVEVLRRGFHPGAAAAAPRVVAVGRGHHDDRLGGVGREGGNVALDLADAFVGVAEPVAEDVVGRHEIHLLGRAGVGIHVLRLVELVGEGRDVPGRVARVRLAVPPARRRRGAQQVRLVRRRGHDVVLVVRQVEVVEIGRAGAAQVVAGDDGPLVAFVHQHVDQRLREGHFGREEALRVVAEVAVAAPGLPPGLLEDLEFLAEHFLGQQRREGVVVGEAHEIQPAPAARFRVAAVPIAAVAEVAAAPELADVVDQRARIAQREAAAGKRAQRILRAELVGVLAVVEPEDVGQVVLRVVVRTEPAVVLAGLEHDGIPRVLHAAVLVAVVVPLRPVDRLVVVPETRDVHVAVGGGVARQAEAEGESGQGPRGQGENAACSVHDFQPYFARTRNANRRHAPAGRYEKHISRNVLLGKGFFGHRAKNARPPVGRRQPALGRGGSRIAVSSR